MVATIAERPDAAWVFKVTGPKEVVDGAESQWRPFLEQVQFDESGVPTWKVPDGWTQSPGNDFRFATVATGSADHRVEIAISKLPAGQDLRTNVNRWRGQLQMPPLSEPDLSGALGQLTMAGQALPLFDATGEMSNSMPPRMAANPAEAASTGAAATSGDGARPKATELPFEFAAPPDWEAGPATEFTPRRFWKREGDRSAQIAVTRLPAATQAWPDTINMWRGELGLEAATADEANRHTSEVQIDGRAAKSASLKAADGSKATRVVNLVDADDSWYFKLTGDAQIVEASQAAFDAFIQSIRFKQP
jgi:hypothetical protein